jgi:hypothetical protein
MVHQLHSPFMFPPDEFYELVNSMPGGSKIDFFGGEPTLHPQFINFLAFASQKNMICSIATNCRTFANSKFTEEIASYGKDSIYIRTSLYGHTAMIHDRIARSDNSFDDCMKGVDNVVKSGMRCQINIVITKDNIEHLDAITTLVIEKGVWGIKFGMIIGASKCSDTIPTIAAIRDALDPVLEKARISGLAVTIEKAPLCAAPEYLDCFSTEQRIGMWTRVHDETGQCSECVVRSWCDGLDPEYVQLHGFDGLVALKRISSNCVRELAGGQEQLSFLKLNVYALPSPIDDTKLAIMEQMISQSEMKFSRLAFVPEELIDTNTNAIW